MHNDCAGHRGLSALPSRCYFGLSRALHTYLLQSLQIVACAYQVHTTATGGWCWYHDNIKKISDTVPTAHGLSVAQALCCAFDSISKHVGAYNWTTGTPFRYYIKLFTIVSTRLHLHTLTVAAAVTAAVGVTAAVAVTAAVEVTVAMAAGTAAAAAADTHAHKKRARTQAHM